ncbi:hypothetical protein AB4043_20835 [Terriglobus sp. YAF25]|uniref:hypothetical protein n=1 Tax=Terriglobus sp. YAF25 TaxID=3233080 RepID=UPI003F97F200
MTVGEYSASLLEAEAESFSSSEEEAECLRDLARLHREMKDVKAVRIWREH